jgi:hypothetical protein
MALNKTPSNDTAAWNYPGLPPNPEFITVQLILIQSR